MQATSSFPSGKHTLPVDLPSHRKGGSPLQQRRRTLGERLVSLLELPGDAVLDVPRAVLIGSMELVVENHRGLVEYRPERVVLRMPEGKMTVDGADLRIGFLSPDQAVILGRIDGLRYAPPEGGGA